MQKHKRRKLAKAHGFTHYYEYKQYLRDRVAISIISNMSMKDILEDMHRMINRCIRQEILNMSNDEVYNDFVKQNVSSNEMPGIGSILDEIE